MAQIVSSNGQFAAAITDHGSMAGILDWQKAAKSQGVKPIFGIEAYFVDAIEDDDEDKNKERFHLILLAKNDDGLQNLYKMTKRAWTEGFYYKPRIDFSYLEEHGNGIIALSGCMGGAISQAIMEDNVDRANMLVERFTKIFNDDFYMEVQPWNDREAGLNLNGQLLDLASAHNVKPVGTIDCHYPTKHDAGFEEVLLMIGQLPSISAPDKRHAKENIEQAKCTHNLIDKMNVMYPNRRLRFENLPLYLMSAEEVKTAFVEAGYDRTDLLTNSVEIAEKCNAEIKTHAVLLPSYSKGMRVDMDSNQYLHEIAFWFLEEKGLADKQVYVDRLNEELDVILGKNFSDYFLILWDLVKWADSVGIARGPSRGSAGGSLLSYVLDITKIDPIEYDLLFERFLDAERADFPDIDLDFEDKRRGEVKQYLKERWGHDNVASITTFGEFKDKYAVKNVASVYQVPYEIANKLTSKFETLEEFDRVSELKEFAREWPQTIEVAKKLRGRYRQSGMHAGGVVVSSVPLHTVLPVETRSDDGQDGRVEVTAYDMNKLEDLGLIKIDILGVKAISVISDAIKKIKEIHGIDVEAQSLDVSNPDEGVFKEFNSGNLAGVFQVEGSGYASLIKEMGIKSFNDLVVSNALVRPGAYVTQGKTYLARREGREKTTYVHPSLEEVLGETYGTIIYQEQLMRMVQVLAGFSKGQANRFRKIVGKKLDKSEFEPYREAFFEGCESKITTEQTQKLWDAILKAAMYQFNKSHAVGYSLLSYQTMWLKVNYPVEFLWSLLNNESEDSKITSYLFEAQRKGFEILPPDINNSEISFSLDNGKIRFGLLNVMGCGPSAAEEIIAKRPYANFEEFQNKVVKSRVKKTVVENLEKIGAFRSIGHDAGYEVKKYYGDILNYPVFLNEQTSYDNILTNCSDVEDDSFAVIRGVVKSTKRTPQYFKVEIEDTTGTYSGFMDKTLSVSKRDSIMAIVHGNSIVAFDDYHNKSDSALFHFIESVYGQEVDFDDVLSTGVASSYDLSLANKFLVYVVSISTFKTKKGQPMATMFAYFPGDKSIRKIVIFPNSFGRLINKIGSSESNWLVLKLSETKRDKTIIVDDAISLERYCEVKSIERV